MLRPADACESAARKAPQTPEDQMTNDDEQKEAHSREDSPEARFAVLRTPRYLLDGP
jgi:hypothetical protein